MALPLVDLKIAPTYDVPDMTGKSDIELIQILHEEWTNVLAQLWIGIGKEVEPARLKIYHDQLKNVPLGLLEMAIDRTMRENTWSTVPPVGVIWQAIRKELNNPYDIYMAMVDWVPIPLSRR